MHKPSQEQLEIIKLVSAGTSVYCDAVAGSGKTTTVLSLAKMNPDKKIIQITYNRQLCDEVREKATGISNIKIYTFHGLAVNYYNKAAYVDSEVIEVCELDTEIQNKPHVDILVVDECQDMTIVLYALVKKFMVDIENENLTLLVLGDHKQAIYEFKGADPRYLTMAENIYGRSMTRKRLSHSYRVTNQIAWLVNDIMMQTNYMVADKEGPKIKYIYDKIFDASYVFRELKILFNEKEITEEDIFVLSGSVKNNRRPFLQL
jgi:superfamily I DNA/RNA helicase